MFPAAAFADRGLWLVVVPLLPQTSRCPNSSVLVPSSPLEASYVFILVLPFINIFVIDFSF